MSLGSYEKIQDEIVRLCLPCSDVVLLALLHAVLFTLSFLPNQQHYRPTPTLPFTLLPGHAPPHNTPPGAFPGVVG